MTPSYHTTNKTANRVLPCLYVDTLTCPAKLASVKYKYNFKHYVCIIISMHVFSFINTYLPNTLYKPIVKLLKVNESLKCLFTQKFYLLIG